jgi:hypothetical protein
VLWSKARECLEQNLISANKPKTLRSNLGAETQSEPSSQSTCSNNSTHGDDDSAALSSRVKLAGREADDLSPTSAEVENGGDIHPPPICLHGVVFKQLSTGPISPSLPFIDSQFNI